eukprot:g33345.t1
MRRNVFDIEEHVGKFVDDTKIGLMVDSEEEGDKLQEDTDRIRSSWTGLYCDVPSVSCEVAAKQQGLDVEQLCRNSGLCIDAGNTHHCRCQAGYTGSYCEEQVDECTPNPCQNGATCTDYLGGYSCK